jgi:hypothetical protein
MTEEIKDLLSRIYDYMDEKSDSIDGPAGEPRPNIQMQFAGEIENILTKPNKSFSKEQVIELLELKDEYIQLLTDELTELVSSAYVHGFRSTRVEAGESLRQKIKVLEKIINAPAPALPQPDPENYTIRDAHDQLDFDGASYQDAIQSPQPTGEEAVVFAEWLEENRVGIDFREERTHTIGELYEIFKKNHQ